MTITYTGPQRQWVANGVSSRWVALIRVVSKVCLHWYLYGGWETYSVHRHFQSCNPWNPTPTPHSICTHLEWQVTPRYVYALSFACILFVCHFQHGMLCLFKIKWNFSQDNNECAYEHSNKLEIEEIQTTGIVQSVIETSLFTINLSAIWFAQQMAWIHRASVDWLQLKLTPGRNLIYWKTLSLQLAGRLQAQTLIRKIQIKGTFHLPHLLSPMWLLMLSKRSLYGPGII